MLKILWKRGEIPEEQFLLLSTIFYYLVLDFYVKTRVRFSLRDKRLFEITEVEITRVDCTLVFYVFPTGSVLYVLIFGGVMRSYGVFFLKFQERFHAKASEVAVMSLIQNIITSITGIIIYNVYRMFSVIRLT